MAPVAFLVRHARLLLALSVFVGLAAPPLAAALKPLLAPTVAALLFLAMLRVDWRRLLDYVRRPKLVALALAWLLVASPLLMWGLVRLTGPEPGIAAALVLMAGAPPIMSAPAMALLLGLDAALALVLVTAATLLAPLTLPVVAGWLSGVTLAVDLGEFTARVAVLILGSFIAALAAHRLLGRRRIAAAAPLVDAGSVLVLVLFAIAVMDGVTATALRQPGWVAAILATAFAANLGLQAAGAWLFRGLGRRTALTLGLVGGNCNMAIVMAALPPGADPDLWLYFALAQFPIYTLPALLSQPYRRLLAGQEGDFSNGRFRSKP